MNKVFLQLWEESSIDNNHLNDGCSLHKSLETRNDYVKSIYLNRGEVVPDRYDRIIGEPITVFVEDKLYDLICEKSSLKIDESSLKNLIKLEELIYNKHEI